MELKAAKNSKSFNSPPSITHFKIYPSINTNNVVVVIIKVFARSEIRLPASINCFNLASACEKKNFTVGSGHLFQF